VALLSEVLRPPLYEPPRSRLIATFHKIAKLPLLNLSGFVTIVLHRSLFEHG
jgi:hypothetical protein